MLYVCYVYFNKDQSDQSGTLICDRSWNQIMHQISLKSDDPQLRYSDETIFNMAVMHRLEFSNFAIMVT